MTAAAKKKRARSGAAKKKGGNVVDIDTKKPSERARAQTHLPGMEPERDEKLTELADALYDVRTQRIALTKQEKEAADRLLAEMRGKELELYVDTDLGLRVEVLATDYKVRVKKFDPDDE